MKVLKDPDQVLQIMNRKLDELHKKFKETEDKLEEAEIYGQKTSIIRVRNHIRCAIEYRHRFDVLFHQVRKTDVGRCGQIFLCHVVGPPF